MRDFISLKPSIYILSIFFLLELPGIFFGCASSLNVEASRIRGLNLDPSSVIAVGSIAGEYGPLFGDELSSALTEKGKFIVSSKRHHSVIQDSIAGKTAQLIGSETGASIYIAGIVDARYSRDREWVKITGKVHLDSGKWVIKQTWESIFHFRIIDLKKGDNLLVYAMSNTHVEAHDEATNIVEGILSAAVSRVGEGRYLSNTRTEIIKEFLRELTLYTEKVELKLCTDDQLPELKEGVAIAHDQQWEKASEMFKDVVNKYPNAPNIDKAYFDLGVACEYSHRFEEAQKYLQKAIELRNELDYKNELQSCKIFEQEYASQMEQSRKTGNR